MLKQYRPRTAGQRHLILTTHETLTRAEEGKRGKAVKAEKKLCVIKRRTNGRNHHGHITCRHRGGGAKKFYRVIDFKRDKEKVPAIVASIEYDPNRSAYIALLHYADGEKRYILAPARLAVGATVASGDGADIAVGNSM